MKFSLSDYETQSALWTKLKAHMEDRLQVLREKNDGVLDADQTARVRGKIEQLKELLSAGEKPDTIRYE